MELKGPFQEYFSKRINWKPFQLMWFVRPVGLFTQVFYGDNNFKSDPQDYYIIIILLTAIFFLFLIPLS